jgi:hypothetical protein
MKPRVKRKTNNIKFHPRLWGTNEAQGKTEKTNIKCTNDFFRFSNIPERHTEKNTNPTQPKGPSGVKGRGV